MSAIFIEKAMIWLFLLSVTLFGVCYKLFGKLIDKDIDRLDKKIDDKNKVLEDKISSLSSKIDKDYNNMMTAMESIKRHEQNNIEYQNKLIKSLIEREK